MRYGGAQHVDVTLGSQRDDMLLRISDDGCEFGDGETAGTGPEMRTMRERASQLAAHFRAGHGERGGAKIDVITLPVDDPSDP